ncbi:helix-turn-helix domain-containing protein [Pareuzebyella sediminis]|uniref:helix-turn-helix domain-containing protein n=1 Tax=Pareuzebyella sediminis TaxID=2607998 RepID=UPI0011EE975A|nr:helix-turn-helix domain-containing protein [Pareuzebyella sediminis]
MDTIQLAEKLDRIEKLLLGSKKVLNLEEAAEYTGISRSYLYKLTSKGIIPHSKPNGKMIFLSKEKLDDWLLTNRRKSSLDISREANSYILKHKK